MQIFITGATGYVGHQLALQAAQTGHQVQALVRDLHSPFLPVHPNIRFFQGDVTNVRTITPALYGCTHVLHAAALTRYWHKDPSLFYRINTEGTQNVLEAARQQGAERLVFTSTCALLDATKPQPLTENDENPAPETHYERSKAAAEKLVLRAARLGFCTTIVALPRLFGPGCATEGNPIGRLIQNMLKRRWAVFPAKDIVANYAFLPDTVNGHFLALERGGSGEKYILGGENVSYERFFEAIRQHAPKSMAALYLPKPLLKAWSHVVYGACTAAGRYTHLTPALVEKLHQPKALSCAKAINQLGYTITPFEEAMKHTVAALCSGAKAGQQTALRLSGS